MTNEMKYLYLPFEIVVREHDGKVALAEEAARAGWTVLLGPKLHLYAVMDQLPEGVFLIKSATPQELGQIRALKAAGHRVFSLDEEGVVTFKEFLGNSVRFSKDTVDAVDRILFWGTEQRNILVEQFPECAGKAIVTGSPRLEFWRDYAAGVYADKVRDLRARYGKYILIPSSFGIANNILGGDAGVLLTMKTGSGLSERTRKFIIGQGEQNLIAFKEYLDFLPHVAQAFPDTQFIVRPHPSEGHDAWRELVGAHGNLHLVYEGSVTPWILGAAGIFHFKSTTSVEAHMMGVPALTYVPPLPPYMDKYELEVPMALSHAARTRGELLRLMHQALAGELDTAGKIDSCITRWMAIDTERRASDKILTEMSAVVPVPQRKLHPPEYTRRQKIKRWFDKVLRDLGALEGLRSRLPARMRKRLGALSYGVHKYAGVDINHTRHVIRSIANVRQSGEHAAGVSLYTETVFIVSPPEQAQAFRVLDRAV